MKIKIDDQISVEVLFDQTAPMQGYEDCISFRIFESGPKDARILKADATGFLITVSQAEQLASALRKAADDGKRFTKDGISEILM